MFAKYLLNLQIVQNYKQCKGWHFVWIHSRIPKNNNMKDNKHFLDRHRNRQTEVGVQSLLKLSCFEGWHLPVTLIPDARNNSKGILLLWNTVKYCHRLTPPSPPPPYFLNELYNHILLDEIWDSNLVKYGLSSAWSVHWSDWKHIEIRSLCLPLHEQGRY